MSEMVERVARAIYEAKEGPFEKWADAPETWKPEWRIAAQAAIAVMREPTDEMIEAGWRKDSNISRTVWIDMIDALQPNDALIEEHGSAR